MDNLYLIIGIVLLVLAVSDVIVGTANDAISFLNSAVNLKAAMRWILGIKIE